MNITEALKITQQVQRDARPFAVTLACGFTPLHLQTFLAAHLQQKLPDRRVTITTGLYGNLLGTVAAILSTELPDGLVIALEWPDLDGRLDYRSAGRWSHAAANDIVSSVHAALDRVGGALSPIPAGLRVALSLPTLPLPPLFHTPGWQASAHQLQLEADLLRVAADIGHEGRIAIVNTQRLNEVSPPDTRFDLKSDLYNGLPYTVQHADRLASQLAQSLLPPPPKKGIISDLDDTLWSGIVGEVGPEAVSWDLAGHSQLHGLYQKLLGSLADSGTLIGVASKNDPATVHQAFERPDLLLRADQVFPIEVHWKAKSGSVTRILETWNIAADSVIFVDDSPMELAEVTAAHPGIECVLFPKNDYAAGLTMLHHLRDRCGKERISTDDALRLDSIRQNAAFREQAAGGAAPETFLQDINAVVTFDFGAANEPRVFELVNKTNQFNLNGRRYTEADWRKLLAAPGAMLAAVSYEDKYGPLGTIAVVAGRVEGACFNHDTTHNTTPPNPPPNHHHPHNNQNQGTGVTEMQFSFAPTAKNGPTREFFTSLIGEEPQSPFRLARSQFEEKCPALYHEVREMRRAEAHG